MKYISTKEFAEKNGISKRRAQVLLKEGRIKGAVQIGAGRLAPWIIPEKAELQAAAGPGRPKKEKKGG